MGGSAPNWWCWEVDVEPSKMITLVLCLLKTYVGIYWNALHYSCSHLNFIEHLNIFLILQLGIKMVSFSRYLGLARYLFDIKPCSSLWNFMNRRYNSKMYQLIPLHQDIFTRNQETFPKEGILEGGHYIHTNDKLWAFDGGIFFKFQQT